MSETVPHRDLQVWVARVLGSFGVPAPRAALVAECLVAANLRGVDSHGVHLLPYYVEHLKRGHIDPAAEGEIASESDACLVYDGRRALGATVADACCGHAVRLAAEHGLGMVVSRNSNHFGAAAFWGLRISRQGYVAVVMCNASAAVPPWQGREGRVGTNPLCVSLPTSGGGRWLLDMATTTVALNKIIRARSEGQTEIPVGWALDASGTPTIEAGEARLLMPLGGYKGSGLGMMAEILCGVLSGGPMSTDVGGTYIFDRPMGTSQMFLAIDPQRFLPAEQLQERMEDLVSRVKNTPPASGYDEVLVAGEPEWRIEEKRLESGIPLDASVRERLGEVASLTGVAPPW